LLTDPERAGSIVRALRFGLPEKPVSCKIRLIKNTQTTVDFCSAMIHAGALAIAIHARYVDDESTKPADWKTLREVIPLLKSKYPSVPLLVNGDFYTRQEWTDMMEETGADGVLLSRSALYNTSIFRTPPAGETGPFLQDSSLLLDKTMVVQDYLRECARYDTYYKNVKYVICEMMNSCRNHPERRIQMPQIYPGGQTIPMLCNSKSSKEICRLWNVTTEDDTTRKCIPSADHHRYDDSYFLKDSNSGATND
jgi:tRNA-dihydrouridine synthase